MISFPKFIESTQLSMEDNQALDSSKWALTKA